MPTPIKRDEVPELDQTLYKSLPPLALNEIHLIIGSEWDELEAEEAAAILAKVCLEAGKWKAVSRDEAEKIADKIGNSNVHRKILSIGLAILLRHGDIQFIEVEDTLYFIPQPSIVNKILGCEMLRIEQLEL